MLIFLFTFVSSIVRGMVVDNKRLLKGESTRPIYVEHEISKPL